MIDDTTTLEILVAREHEAEQEVARALQARDDPINDLLDAFDSYRRISQACSFAIPAYVEQFEARLWQAHTEGKKYFSGALRKMRKQPERAIETRQLIKFYLRFIKDSQRFYRGYILALNETYGGIAELQAIAHQVQGADAAESESSQQVYTAAERAKALLSCHLALIYLGDLSRYRASEQLDRTPDFGPAIGYYSLACALRPASGMGHHQQAVIALEQKAHLRAIYHLYRAIVVEDPHPVAANNLMLEFGKVNAAWDKGELVQKGQPNDPEGPKHALIGWFIRLHSMCFKGEPYRGHSELEREVLGQLGAAVRQVTPDHTLMRMVIINLASQFNAGELYQGKHVILTHNDHS